MKVSRKKLDERAEARVVELFLEEKLSLGVIATRFGVGESTITRILRTRNVARRPMGFSNRIL
jgi:transposase